MRMIIDYIKMLKKRKAVVLFLIFFVTASSDVFAQQNTSNTLHPIESNLRQCLQLNTSSFGAVECEIERYNQWNNQLDRVYDELMSRVNPQERQLLIKQQIAWARYRDLQFKMNEDFYGRRGSIWLSTIASFKGNLVKSRVLILESYLNLLKSEQK